MKKFTEILTGLFEIVIIITIAGTVYFHAAKNDYRKTIDQGIHKEQIYKGGK